MSELNMTGLALFVTLYLEILCLFLKKWKKKKFLVGCIPIIWEFGKWYQVYMDACFIDYLYSSVLWYMVFLNLVSNILLILVYLLLLTLLPIGYQTLGKKEEKKKYSIKKQKLILLHFDILIFFFFPFLILKFVCPIMQVFILFSVIVSLLFEFLALVLLKGMHCSKLCFSNLSVS